MRFRATLLVGVITSVPIDSLANEISGNLAIGWRNVAVSGARNKYDEDINLGSGPRLREVSFIVRPDSPDSLQPDLIEVDARNLGGDPFESLRLSVRKYGAYSFRAQRHRSAWFYDDLIVLPEDASVNGSTGGDFHRFNVERVRDDVALTVQLSERAKLNMGFDRNSRTGDSTTTLDISRDEFELDKPVEESMESWRLGVDYRWQTTTLSLEERVHDFESNGEWFLPGYSAGENTSNLTTLDFYFLSAPYAYRNREHVVQVTSSPSDRFQLTAMAMLGRLNLDTRIDERSQGIDFTGAPFVTDDSGGGSIGRDTAATDFTLRFALNEKLSLSAGLRHRALDQDGNIAFSPSEGGQGSWDIDSTAYDFGVSWLATAGLEISAGWQNQDRDVDSVKLLADGSSIQAADNSSADNLYVNVNYRPNKRLRFNARLNDQRHEDPYSLASPNELTRYRLQASYRNDRGTHVNVSHSRNDRENDLGQWSASSRQSTLRVSHTMSDVTLSLGATILDSSQRYQRLVSGGTRQDLFVADYSADTHYTDAALRWTIDDRWAIGGHWRHYDNGGSFKVKRDDWRTFIDVSLPRNYTLSFSYRDIDFEEDAIEQYKAGIFEAVLRLRL